MRRGAKGMPQRKLRTLENYDSFSFHPPLEMTIGAQTTSSFSTLNPTLGFDLR
jgi:hypothetical protein